MKLLTVGDSFTFGEELNSIYDAWPFVLGQINGYEVTNLARPGSGNKRMVRTVIEQVDQYDIVIIAWSHYARAEWADSVGVYDVWPGCNAAAHEQHAPWRKWLIDHITHNYDDHYLYRQYVLDIILLQTYLKAHNKKYVMLDAFGNNTDPERFYPVNIDLHDKVDASTFLGWPTESMMQWTYPYPQGPRGHFLKEGHTILAQKIADFIEKQNWQF